MGTHPTPTPVPDNRLVSLDAYRGFTMLAMCSGGLGLKHLLNDPSWGWLADQFEHRQWEGCTAWDLIQPSFMFIVGVAMPFAFALRRTRGDSWGRQFRHAVQRAFLLILIGVVLDSMGKKWIEVQFIRVLQQIAIGYVIAFLVLDLRPRWQFAVAALLLIGHSLAFWLYGGSSGGAWSKDTNIGTAIDQFCHVSQDVLGWVEFMPLSKGGYVTVNAISSAATIIFGVLCGELLCSALGPWKKVGIMVAAGLVGLGLGTLLGGSSIVHAELPVTVPAVKKIWTASFGLFAVGWTLLSMAAFYLIIDVWGWKRSAFPFVVVGMNSIAIYVLSSTMTGRINETILPFAWWPLHFVPLFAPIGLALLMVLVKWAFCYWLYRHRIFFKV